MLEMISALLLALTQSPSAIGPDDFTARAWGSDLVFKITLPGYKEAPVGLAGFRKDPKLRDGNQVRFYGGIKGSQDAHVTVITYIGDLPSSDWRKRLLDKQLVGAGQFDIGGAACTEAVRDMNPPYKVYQWHGFPVAAGICLDIHVDELTTPDAMPVTRADFEAMVKSVHFAISRCGEWAEMPQDYLDLSDEACLKPDGVAWLKERATKAPSEPLVLLALAQHMLSADAAPEDVAKAFEAAVTAFESIVKPTKELMFARALALDGACIAHVRTGKAGKALKEITQARELTASASANARSGFAYDLATAHAASKDAGNTVKALKEAIDLDPSLRLLASMDKNFESVRGEKAFADLVAPPKK
jgi:hypothetical protein